MPPSVSCSPTASPHAAGPSPTAAASSSHDVLRGLRCTPLRRSLKFTASAHARHFLAFDTSISRETRLVLFMEVFVFRQLLVDAAVVPAFQLATYTPEELLEVRVVTDPRHPAYGQAGLYAKSFIPHNTIVTSYSGFIEVFATSCNSRTYTMGFGSIGDDYALDAEFVGNYGRYANDPRGIGKLQANLSAENRFNSRGESFTALVARRQINMGEEILMSYGKAHRLSATPWTTLQGDPMMRPRMGGLVPFPAFRCTEAPLHSRIDRGAVDATTSSAPRAAETIFPAKHEADEMRNSYTPKAAMDTSASCSSPSKNGCGVAADDAPEKTMTAKIEPAGSSTATAAAPPLPRMANDLLWECTQCGMWTICEASVADAPLPCSACGTPKLSGSRLISLLSSPAITQQALLQEAGLRGEFPQPEQSAVTLLPSSVSPLSPPPTQSSCSPSTAATTSPSPLSSEHIDWPMNVPFLPWQVWDAAVPLSVLAKHSRFETQKHMFLYTVDTGLNEERRKSARDTATSAAAERRDHRRRRTEAPHTADEDWPFRCRYSKKKAKSGTDAVCASSTSCANLFTRASQAESGRGSRRSSGGGDDGGPDNRLKRGELWQRQDEVNPEDLAGFHRWLEPATPLTSPAASEDSTYSLHIFSPFSISPWQQQQQHIAASPHEATRADASFGDFTECGGEVRATLAKSPLSLLMSPTQEMDRLIVLRRAFTASTTSDGNSSAVPADTRDSTFSPQMASMRRRLQCMTRRLFTGKAFQAGEVVSYVGGLVRLRGDSRCRVSDSCLEIPLRFFLPSTLRQLCRMPMADNAQARGTGEGRPSTRYSGERTALHRFCQRVDGLSLVVTNEFMYCPCVVWDEEERADVSTEETTQEGGGPQSRIADAAEEVANALKACNVALVLTLDSLGCPYACAVATKAIGAFEPLLARAQ
ncbi:hypothetical protein ABL78_0659 [Leptomonas seymouri]|uniref:SET domain-containing protein n=1 Tax=Leptomonas seymouri TaxID=5684 RepID=A0A0N0P946_LEPSE|nr:hypothetical protein ABL78_0659 [Leptomonas seymouri]|eukprot:KPI90277.1 hypothetical protein ABL78_0659 [Leptomonas seymouri]